MPILVQWKWKERTKTFLVIFRFIDDFSKPNLRVKIYSSYGANAPARADMTWAPSHVELGLLSELLGYANIIDGLSGDVKTELRKKLEILFEEKGAAHTYWEFAGAIGKEIPKRPCIIDVGKFPDDWRFWAPVCPEYIDYLKRVLKPYLRN